MKCPHCGDTHTCKSDKKEAGEKKKEPKLSELQDRFNKLGKR